MGIKFFFDEGLGYNLAKGLNTLGKNVVHVRDVFKPGTEDVVWLEYVGKNQFALVTKDKGIRRKPNEKAMLLKHKVVAFYLGGSEKSGHDVLRQLVNAWENMEEKAASRFKKGTAYAFYVRPNGRTIDDLPLT